MWALVRGAIGRPRAQPGQRTAGADAGPWRPTLPAGPITRKRAFGRFNMRVFRPS